MSQSTSILQVWSQTDGPKPTAVQPFVLSAAVLQVTVKGSVFTACMTACMRRCAVLAAKPKRCEATNVPRHGCTRFADQARGGARGVWLGRQSYDRHMECLG